MALFKRQHIAQTPAGFLEVSGKIFLDGVGYDATTLAPLMNEHWPSHDYGWQRGSYNAPMISAKNRCWNWASLGTGGVTSSSTQDTTLFDGGAGKVNLIYEPVSNPSQVLIGRNSHILYPAPVIAQEKSYQIYNKSTLSWVGYSSAMSGTITSYGAGDNAVSGTNFDAHIGGFLYERDSSNVYHWSNGHRVSGSHFTRGGNGTVSSARTRISLVNLTNHTSSSNIGFFVNTADGGGNAVAFTPIGHASLIWESGTDFYIFQCPMQANGEVVSTLSKSVFTNTTRGTYTRPVGSQGPAYWPSWAVTTTGTTRVSFKAEYLASSGNQYKILVTSFDDSNPNGAITFTAVTPGNASGMPGASTVSMNLATRTWAFKNGSDIYICVGIYDPSTTGSGFTNGHYYIHTYKTTTADPTIINYVNSIAINTGNKPNAIMPANSNWDQVLVPYAVDGGGLDILSWNQGQENYVRTSSLSIAPRGIAVDQTGRIWIAENNSGLNAYYHVISPTIATTITATFQNTALTYSGSTINTNLVVNAYNAAGTRIVNNVTIQIDSTVCTFDDDTLTKTVTTSSSADTNVPIKVKGAGYIRILANLAI